jgi:FHS family glucose/mannose:H+ symporter-like MFS transporter
MSRDQSSRSEPVSAAEARWIVLASCLMAVSVGLTIGALGTSLPAMHARLHAPLGQLGILIGVNFFGSLAVTLVLGPLLDRHSARPWLICGSLCFAAGLLLVTVSTSLGAAILAFSLAGFGGGTNTVASAVLTTRLFHDHGGRAMSWINMSFGMGAFTGPLAAAATLEHLHDYSPVFVAIALTVVAPTIVFARVRLPGIPQRHAASGTQLRRSEWRLVALLSLISFVYLGAEIGFGGWAYSFVLQATGADTQTASFAPSGFWLALSAGSIGAAMRPAWMAADRLILFCALFGAVAAATFVAAPNATSAIIAASMYGICLGPIYPLNIAAASGLIPRAAGLVSAIVICSSQIGGGVMPWVQGMVMAWSTRPGGAVTLMLCLALAALQAVFIAGHARERRAGEPAA